MIILPSHKLCIITPPHTASRHLHLALCKPEIGGLYTVGPNPDGILDHHVVKPCSEYYHFHRVLIVRNPISRAAGLYRHYVWACVNMPNTIKCSGLHWQEFAECLATDNYNKLDWLYRYTITRLINNISYDFVIKYEELSSQIDGLLGYHVDIPGRYNDSPEEYLQYYHDENTLTNIKIWGHPDIQRFY